MNFTPRSILEKEKFSAKKRAKSFTHAGRGVWLMVKTTHNAWVQLGILVAAVFLGFYFSISLVNWLFIVLASGVVLLAEALNTAIEMEVNMITPHMSSQARDIKDVAAGAVLVAAMAAFVVGVCIFLPYLVAIFAYYL